MREPCKYLSSRKAVGGNKATTQLRELPEDPSLNLFPSCLSAKGRGQQGNNSAAVPPRVTASACSLHCSERGKLLPASSRFASLDAPGSIIGNPRQEIHGGAFHAVCVMDTDDNDQQKALLRTTAPPRKSN